MSDTSAPRVRGGGPTQTFSGRAGPSCSPRARGWSRLLAHVAALLLVLPACAGVVPPAPSAVKMTACSPRARGWSSRPRRNAATVCRAPRVRWGGPIHRAPRASGRVCSPRARGWSRPPGVLLVRRVVLPACAGVVPCARPVQGRARGAPRVRGGGPATVAQLRQWWECSPRARGWSRDQGHLQAVDRVLPACAGVVPCPRGRRTCCPGAPRVRGGGPGRDGLLADALECSPRARGWSLVDHGHVEVVLVLPACAGVVPRRRSQAGLVLRAPRVRGGGPVSSPMSQPCSSCSPRARGWSHSSCPAGEWEGVLPACAGVVPPTWRSARTPGRAPRVRGGGPVCSTGSGSSTWCSPRARGWSLMQVGGTVWKDVLPACAGVVPHHEFIPTVGGRAPRVRGGGPWSKRSSPPAPWCSPRARGWSPLRNHLINRP